MKKLDLTKQLNISDESWVKVKKTGHITELSYVSYRNQKAHIKKLNADEYVLLKNGEVNNFAKTDNRSESFSYVRQSLRNVSDYININVTNSSFVHWITLTYKQRENANEAVKPMRDTKKLYLDFQCFMRDLRKKYSDNKIEYIAVAEPQKSGSWHMHVILIWDIKAPYISNAKLASIWKHGFVKINGLNPNCDNIGAYFSAYLTDIEYEKDDKLNEDESIKEVTTVKGKKKKFIKGGRLKYYPSGMNIYRCSRGIKKADEFLELYKNVKTINMGVCTYKKSFLLVNEKDPESLPITVVKEYYNLKRKTDKLSTIADKLKKIKNES